MFKTLQNAFKIKDVRRRIFYVFLMLVVVRLGTQIPVPGVNGDYFKEWFASQTGDAFNFSGCLHRRILLLLLHLCAEYYSLHYIFHYRSASDHRHPKASFTRTARRDGRKLLQLQDT